MTALLAHLSSLLMKLHPGCREELVKEKGAPAFLSCFSLACLRVAGSPLAAAAVSALWPIRSRVMLVGRPVLRGTRGLQAGRPPARFRDLVFLRVLGDLVSRKLPSLTLANSPALSPVERGVERAECIYKVVWQNWGKHSAG